MDPKGGFSRHRPAYHITAAGGWMGDPNGLIYHDGLYHVMYQHNPDTVDFLGNDTWRKMEKVPWGPAANPGVPKGIWGLYWGNAHWGHAVSRDLVHWEHWPVAISPTAGGYDPGGCFSGVTVINGGVPTIVYSSITKIPASGIRSLRAQSIATSSDGMRTWTKHPGNPVLADVPDTSGLMHAWHDPHVWQEQGTWYMAVGCGFQNVAGAILLYRSPDLVHWEYMHPLLVSTDVQKQGDRWLVPDFFALGDKHVLLYCASTPGGEVFTAYVVGNYVDNCLIPEAQGALGPRPAPSAMATRTLCDARGRRIAFSQLGEECGPDAKRNAGVNGALSLPWELTLGDDLVLELAPVQEVCSAGDPNWSFGRRKLSHDEPFCPDGLVGDALEILAEIDLGSANEIALTVLASSDGQEETVVLFNARECRLSLDRSRATLSREHCEGAVHDTLDLAGQGLLRLHVFVDRTIVEAFANRRGCVFGRIPPPDQASTSVSLVARGGEATVLRLDAWRKDPVPIADLRK
ncbi:MAG: glycoside hydrolase family 32 protein [Phycisphaerae bacterium]|jgi:beta-fructofuranosidase|nr:glycoside hydrolase family 32 protein [Phycisphaerae bacterium]